MESNTLGSIAGRVSSCALSPVAARSVVTELARPRTALIVDPRSQGGVGSSAVRGMWRIDAEATGHKSYDTHQDFYNTFTTRQGPPICSPPA